MRARQLTMAIAALAWLAAPAPQARADWPLYFAHITCSPELGYFKLEPILSYAPTQGDPRRAGAYDARQLEASPVVCELPQYRIVVEGRYSVTGRGPCGAVRGQQARVTINGAIVDHRFEGEADQTDAADGWHEITGCDNNQGRTVRALVNTETGEWASITFCREAFAGGGQGEVESLQQCRTWNSYDADFPFH